MSEANMRVDAMEGLAAPPFHPVLTDADGGSTFTMLGTTMRLIATVAGVVLSQSTVERAHIRRDAAIQQPLQELAVAVGSIGND